MLKESKKTNVYIVEDDKNIREALRYNLIAQGFNVEFTGDGISAIETLLNKTFDIILLDLMLPGIDGLEICKRLRSEHIDTPIIILTAKDNEIDKIVGLELGADDYVSKPFSMPELLARIKANLRRNLIKLEKTKSITRKQFTHLDTFIDLDKRIVKINDKNIFFRPKEFDLLYKLMSNPGKVFTREKLIEEIWGFQYFGDTRTVDVHIRWIREKIESDSEQPQKILTVRGFGYKSKLE